MADDRCVEQYGREFLPPKKKSCTVYDDNSAEKVPPVAIPSATHVALATTDVVERVVENLTSVQDLWNAFLVYRASRQLRHVLPFAVRRIRLIVMPRDVRTFPSLLSALLNNLLRLAHLEIEGCVTLKLSLPLPRELQTLLCTGTTFAAPCLTLASNEGGFQHLQHLEMHLSRLPCDFDDVKHLFSQKSFPRLLTLSLHLVSSEDRSFTIAHPGITSFTWHDEYESFLLRLGECSSLERANLFNARLDDQSLPRCIKSLHLNNVRHSVWRKIIEVPLRSVTDISIKRETNAGWVGTPLFHASSDMAVIFPSLERMVYQWHRSEIAFQVDDHCLFDLKTRFPRLRSIDEETLIRYPDCWAHVTHIKPIASESADEQDFVRSSRFRDDQLSIMPPFSSLSLFNYLDVLKLPATAFGGVRHLKIIGDCSVQLLSILVDKLIASGGNRSLQTVHVSDFNIQPTAATDIYDLYDRMGRGPPCSRAPPNWSTFSNLKSLIIEMPQIGGKQITNADLPHLVCMLYSLPRSIQTLDVLLSSTDIVLNFIFEQLVQGRPICPAVTRLDLLLSRLPYVTHLALDIPCTGLDNEMILAGALTTSCLDTLRVTVIDALPRGSDALQMQRVVDNVHAANSKITSFSLNLFQPRLISTDPDDPSVMTITQHVPVPTCLRGWLSKSEPIDSAYTFPCGEFIANWRVYKYTKY